MAVYIAHSSIDENGKISRGKAGDQTKKEICIRTWYSTTWGYVLRIKDEAVRNQFADNMIDLANNDNVGYDQGQRNTLLTEAEKVGFDFSKIVTKCECDCSSAITICILGAIYKVHGEAAYKTARGILVVSGNCATTRTLRSRLKNTKMPVAVSAYSSTTYTRSTSKAVFGDIYLKEGSHVVAFIGDGNKAGSPSNTPNEQKPNTAYTGNSIVAYLNSIGKPSDFTSRKEYAKQYGINGYSGTASQNIKLLNLMRGDVKVEEVAYYPKYTGTSCSIVSGLMAIKVDSSIKNRKKIAAANNIANYSGKASQNSQMLKLLKQGKLKKA